MYLANPCGAEVVEAMSSDPLLGMIDTPYQRKPKWVSAAHDLGVLWCADNGAFSDVFDETSWWGWLTAQQPRAATCLFAVAPDVVADAAATLERSTRWLPRIRELGFPVAYVAQNGFDGTAVPWADFDVLFLGGDDAFKLGPAARAAVVEAHARGKRVHMGRVNSRRRWVYAEGIGCDTVDGTFLTFGPSKNLPRLRSWSADTPLDLFGVLR